MPVAFLYKYRLVETMTPNSAMPPPLVSVVVPSFNHEKYVWAALESVVSQDYPRVQLIVIDDGSQDRSFEIIQQHYQRYCGDIECYSIKCHANVGAQPTLNVAIRQAAGQYILMLASDDELESHALSDLVYQLERDPAAAVCVPDSCFIDAKGDVIRILGYDSVFAYQTRNNKMVNKSHLAKFGCYETLLYGNYIPNGSLLRREVLTAIKDFGNKPYPEDYAVWLEVSKVSRMLFLPKKLFRYRIHGENSITVQAERISVGMFMQLLAERDFAINHGYKRDWANSVVHQCVRYLLDLKLRLAMRGLAAAGVQMTISIVASKLLGKIPLDKKS